MLLARSRSLALLAPLTLLVLAACTEGTGPGGGGGGIFGGIDLGNTGLGGAGFAGYAGTTLPRDYSYLFAREVFGEGEQCIQSGACGHGGGATQYANLVGSDSLLFVTTSDVPAENDLGATVTAVVQTSGIQHDSLTLPASSSGKRLRMSLEFAFLQSSAATQDSAVIQLEIEGQRVRLFRVRGADVGGTLPARPGGCGTADVGGAVAFPVCTDWQSREIDLTPYRGRRTPIRFVVGEQGRTAGRAVTLLVRAIRFEEEQ